MSIIIIVKKFSYSKQYLLACYIRKLPLANNYHKILSPAQYGYSVI